MSTGRGPFVGVDPLGDAADVDAAAYDDEPDNVAPWYPRHMRVNLRKLKVGAVWESFAGPSSFSRCLLLLPSPPRSCLLSEGLVCR